MKKLSSKSNAVVKGLVDYLKSEGEENILPEVTKSLEDLKAKAIRRDEIIITSSVQLTRSQLNEIQKVLKRKFFVEYPIINEINEDLIGGFTLKINDWFFDGSMSNQLRNIKRTLIS